MNTNEALAGTRPVDGWLTPQRLVMGVFAAHAAIMNNWFPRIPDVQAALGLTPGELAIALVGMPLGGLVGTSLAAYVTERFGTRTAMVAGLLVAGVASALPGFAVNIATLFASLLLVGVALIVVEVGMNVEASRMRTRTGRQIMSTCHGFWCVGSIIGLVGGALFAEAGISVKWHLTIAAAIIVPVSVLFAAQLPSFVPSVRGKGPLFALPTLGIIGFCAVAVGSVVADLTARNWGAIFLRDTLLVSPTAVAVAFGVFAGVQTVCRFLGDRAVERFGAFAVGATGAALMTAGIVLLAIANSAPMAIAALAVLGVGVSPLMPLAMMAAAAYPGTRPAAVNVASVSVVVFAGSMVAPPVVGFVADQFGMRLGIIAVLPLVVLSLVFAKSLPRRG